MGRKIFVSYKYSDRQVEQFTDLNNLFREEDTARSYVNLLEQYIKNESDHIYKGEENDEDLSSLSEATIRDKLYSRIYDSTLTIILVSSGMKEYKEQKYQWIPQEISYSLREQSRFNSSGQRITSSTNAMLAIVLPDRNGSYDYYTYECPRCPSHCIVHKIDWLFPIMRENTFNIKKPDSKQCDTNGSTIYHGYPSYISYVKWTDFKTNPEKYISKAYEIQENKEDYDIHVQL